MKNADKLLDLNTGKKPTHRYYYDLNIRKKLTHGQHYDLNIGKKIGNSHNNSEIEMCNDKII